MTGPETDATGRSAPSGRVLLCGGAAATLGAVIGYALFRAVLSQGVVMLPLPGAVIGIARDLATRRRSWGLGAWSVALALATQAYCVHGHFMNGFAQLDARGWLGFAAGAGIAAWFGSGRERVKSSVNPADETPKS